MELNLTYHKISIFEINQAKKYFPEFDTYWKPASRSSKFGRASGGCVYGVKKELQKKGIRHSFKAENGVDVIRFHVKDDIITFIPLYIRGAAWHEEIEVVKEFFKENTEKISVVMGDPNVRVGNIQQNIEDLYTATFSADTGKTSSRDAVLNNRGKNFMDFCEDYGLIILNGRTAGDEEGNLTYISAVGNSVNDICAVSHEGLKYIERFEVESKVWSDHMPIKLILKTNMVLNELENINLLPKVVLKGKDKINYQLKLNQYLNKFKNGGEIMDLKKLADVIKMSVPQSPARNIKITFKNAWFNFKCFKARELCFKYLNDFRKSNIEDDKQKYLKANQFYRNAFEKAKKEYYEKNGKTNQQNCKCKRMVEFSEGYKRKVISSWYKYHCERF